MVEIDGRTFRTYAEAAKNILVSVRLASELTGYHQTTVSANVRRGRFDGHIVGSLGNPVRISLHALACWKVLGKPDSSWQYPFQCTVDDIERATFIFREPRNRLRMRQAAYIKRDREALRRRSGRDPMS